jgi:hypothetical protein
MQEEILLKRSRTGTTIHFFNSDINENNYSVSTIPAILKYGSEIELNAFDGVNLTGSVKTFVWERSTQGEHYGDENYTPIQNPHGLRMNFIIGDVLPNPNYISGRTFSQTTNVTLTPLKKQTIKNRFINSMNALFTASTSTTEVFFEDTTIDDMFVNIKLERTF